MGDGNIDVGVENLDLIFEETAVDNVPDNNDVDETKIPRGKSIAHHILFDKASYVPSCQYGRSKHNSYSTWGNER